MRLTYSILAATVLATAGCRTTGQTEETQAKSASSGSSYYQSGFAIVAGKCSDDRAKPCDATVRDTAGRLLESKSGTITPAEGAGLSFDQGEYEGSTVFKWPAEDEVINRDYDRLGALMDEYGRLVGTLLHRGPRGGGEVAWRGSIRGSQRSACSSAQRRGSEEWCKAVVENLIDTYVPSGSQYRQYGNCGEGGKVGACLAKRAGFKDDEIRLCSSENDHFFAMVYRGVDPATGKDHKWCMLDRWDLIGRFNCDVDVDTSTRKVTHKGQPTGQEWFDKVTCSLMPTYLKR
jgi:hypothetical protein